MAHYNFHTIHIFLCLLLLVAGCRQGESAVRTSTQDLNIVIGQSQVFQLIVEDVFAEDQQVRMEANHEGLLRVDPAGWNISAGAPGRDYDVEVTALEPGHTVLSAHFVPGEVDTTGAFVRVTNMHSEALRVTSVVIGWLYFVAWSVSFYPQIYQNYQRKSVVGLNFDFLSLNLIGFTLYSLFNCGLYWIPAIEDEYFVRYPRGANPVLLNDVVFALHAVAATLVTIGQCFIYERGNQRVSLTARVIMGLFAVFLLVSLILAITPVLHWLDFLYYCSYVKLAITLIKYVPQAYMNYKRKSTEGWSIGNIFLDFTGGMLSMLQMMLNAHNYNDWASIFGDPTKFGLGLFSVVFDIFFIVQHYILYRDSESKSEKLSSSTDVIVDRMQEPELKSGLGNPTVDSPSIGSPSIGSKHSVDLTGNKDVSVVM